VGIVDDIIENDSTFEPEERECDDDSVNSDATLLDIDEDDDGDKDNNRLDSDSALIRIATLGKQSTEHASQDGSKRILKRDSSQIAPQVWCKAKK